MARLKESEGLITSENFVKKGGDNLIDHYAAEISFGGYTTDLLFAPGKVKHSKKDGSEMEFDGQMIIFNNESPTYLFKQERKANPFRKAIAVPSLSGRLMATKDDDELENKYITVFSIVFTPMPTEDKIQSWKYVISKNEAGYDIYLRNKNRKQGEETSRHYEDNDTPF